MGATLKFSYFVLNERIPDWVQFPRFCILPKKTDGRLGAVFKILYFAVKKTNGHLGTRIFGDIYIITDNNYHLLIIFQQVDIYLNEPITIDGVIKLGNQSIQRRIRDRTDRDNNNSYF